MREKHTFRSNEIAHVWANKNATWGKCPGNMSFDGDIIRSYGTAIARHVEHNGKRGVIFNNTGYSVTTNRSQSAIRQAIPSYLTVLVIGNVQMGTDLSLNGDAQPGKLFAYAIRQADYHRQKAEKARTRKEYHLNEQRKWLQYASEANSFFELGHTVDEETIKRLEEIARQEKERQELAEKQRQERLVVEYQHAYDNWKDGFKGEYFPRGLFPLAFRIEEQEVVSTQGARVPLREARIALRFIQKHRESGWRTNGEKFSVGGYQLVQITDKEVQIGCHHISWEEIDRIEHQIHLAADSAGLLD